jgi:hypothetical protein
MVGKMLEDTILKHRRTTDLEEQQTGSSFRNPRLAGLEDELNAATGAQSAQAATTNSLDQEADKILTDSSQGSGQAGKVKQNGANCLLPNKKNYEDKDLDQKHLSTKIIKIL